MASRSAFAGGDELCRVTLNLGTVSKAGQLQTRPLRAPAKESPPGPALAPVLGIDAKFQGYCARCATVPGFGGCYRRGGDANHRLLLISVACVGRCLSIISRAATIPAGAISRRTQGSKDSGGPKRVHFRILQYIRVSFAGAGKMVTDGIPMH